MGKRNSQPSRVILIRSIIITIVILIPSFLAKTTNLWEKIQSWIGNNTGLLLLFFIPSFLVLTVWVLKYFIKENKNK